VVFTRRSEPTRGGYLGAFEGTLGKLGVSAADASRHLQALSVGAEGSWEAGGTPNLGQAFAEGLTRGGGGPGRPCRMAKGPGRSGASMRGCGRSQGRLGVRGGG